MLVKEQYEMYIDEDICVKLNSYCVYNFRYLIYDLVLCQDLAQIKMRDFSA